MSEKRFTVESTMVRECILDNASGEQLDTFDYTERLCDLLNEQQATIINLQGDVNRLNYIIEELKKDNYKQFEKINELKAKLKEKQEDEKLYAQEILELNKTKKEMLNFKQLGGDY